MKRNRKMSALAAALCAATVLCGCAGSQTESRASDRTANDMSAMSRTGVSYDRRTYEASSQVRNVVIKDQDTPIQVKPSADGKVSVSYYRVSNKSEHYSITEENGTLKVAKELSKRYTAKSHDSDNPSYRKIRLVIFIPKQYKENLSLTSSDGDVVAGKVKLKNLTADMNDADLSFRKTSVKNLTVTAGDGDVDFYHATIRKKLKCNLTDGDVEGSLTGRRSDYSISARVSDGDSNLKSRTKGKKKLNISVIDGDIELSFDGK